MLCPNGYCPIFCNIRVHVNDVIYMCVFSSVTHNTFNAAIKRVTDNIGMYTLNW